jgi:hypothetical protein
MSFSKTGFSKYQEFRNICDIDSSEFFTKLLLDNITYFSQYYSEFIDMYKVGMNTNPNLVDQYKTEIVYNIKQLLNQVEYKNKQIKQILCIFIFTLLNTPLYRKFMEKHPKFQKTVINKKKEFEEDSVNIEFAEFAKEKFLKEKPVSCSIIKIIVPMCLTIITSLIILESSVYFVCK